MHWHHFPTGSFPDLVYRVSDICVTYVHQYSLCYSEGIDSHRLHRAQYFYENSDCSPVIVWLDIIDFFPGCSQPGDDHSISLNQKFY